MRQFRYPTAIPPLETRPVDPQTGTWTYEWRSWFEAMQLQAGGQGGDAIYDASIAPFVLAEENRDKIEALERLVRSQDAQLSAALAALGDLARIDTARAQNIGSNELGGVASVSPATHDWATSSPSASWAPSDLNNFQTTTSALRLNPGQSVRIRFSYVQRCIKDAFEHFTYRDRVTLQGRQGGGSWSNLNVFDYVEGVFSTTANTGAVDGNYGASANVSKREFDEWTYATSSGASFDEVRAILDVEAWDADRAAGVCIVGTVDNAKIVPELRLTNANLVLEHVRSGPFQVR